MGDEAEQVFTEVYGRGYVVWGLRRPSIKVSALPAKIRYAPDYLTSDGFVEVMGVGRDQVLKLKVEKHIALLQWNQEMPTRLFIWDSSNRRHCLISVSGLTEQLGIATPGAFPEGKRTWNIPIGELRAEWQTPP